LNRLQNPFSPGAGSPPPELAGRDDLLEQAEVLLARVLAKRSEKSILMIGLRGVGKTVLLNEIERRAEKAGYRTIFVEAHESKPLPTLIVPPLRRLLYELDRLSGAGHQAKRGLAVLKSFMSGLKAKVGDIEIGLDVEAERGSADSGDLEADLSSLFVAVAEAAQERRTGVALLIDEIQYLTSDELSALIMAMHKMQQRQLPLVLFGAGLPILPGLAGESKSYAERLFSYPNIGPLSRTDTDRALQDPLKAAGHNFDELALAEIYRLTEGYPYFLQEWGYQSWNRAEASPIGLQVIKETTQIVTQRLDENFFKVRFDRLTPTEKRYLRAMSSLGAGPYRTSDIAKALGRQVRSVAPIRDNLMKKGMVFSPSHGEMAFTVPLFDGFMVRAISEFDEDQERS
jgi:hypothetical protein